MRKIFKDKVLLITGGTGSFGQAVLKKFLDTDIKEIRIFSRDEKKQEDMRRSLNNLKVKFYIGDVRDKESIEVAIKGVDYVFHAAALKQVPSCEFFPMEAVKTNVIGTENLLNAAINYKVKKVICLSTDKAAYPICAMGISKSMMEKLMVSKSRETEGTIICGTRYGNLMGTRGSVIPFFLEKIKNEEDLTVTNPNMTRYLMTPEEAVDLVIYAFENAKPGDIFVKKAPACTVGDLTKALIEVTNAKSKVKIIGMRHSEKMHETLMTTEETYRAEDMGTHFRISADNRNLNYDRFNYKDVVEAFDENSMYTSENTNRLTVEDVKKLLKYIKNY